jgi:hypothetical protein
VPATSTTAEQQLLGLALNTALALSWADPAGGYVRVYQLGRGALGILARPD